MQSRRRIDSSSIIAHPVNSDHTGTLGEIVKTLYQELDWRQIYIYIYDALDHRYGFSISLQPGIDCTTSHFSWNVWKKKVFKIVKSWQVWWLVGEVDNHVAIDGSKVAEGFSLFQRRSCLLIRQYLYVLKCGRDGSHYTTPVITLLIISIFLITDTHSSPISVWYVFGDLIVPSRFHLCYCWLECSTMLLQLCWAWISNYIPQNTAGVITYLCSTVL